MLLGELGNLVGGILGIVAAGVEEEADVVGFEDFEHALVVSLLLELVAAGAEGGARGKFQAADGLLGLGGEVDEVFLEDAENAVERAVNLLDFDMIERFGDDAGHAGVDDGGGTAGLAYQDITCEFFGHVRVLG